MQSYHFHRNRDLVLKLGDIARLVGQEILSFSDPEAQRRTLIEGHQVSTVNDHARNVLDHHFFRRLGAEFNGRLLTVLRPVMVQPTGVASTQSGVVLAHESSGGVALFRSKVCGVQFRPAAAVGLALCETSDFADLVGGAVYDIAQDMSFDAVRVSDDCFEAHVGDKRLVPSAIPEGWDGESVRVLITNYNNASVTQRAEVEQKLWNEGFYVSPGSHSSMVDLVHMAVLRLTDAVIDFRMFQKNERGDSDSVLTLKEVAAAILGLDDQLIVLL
ncbi:MAG TPA: hypothetical protein PLP17_02965, partial [Oligoflexia bacterium]|nr:hypothetical protein [Oligoflexia bacterium]